MSTAQCIGVFGKIVSFVAFSQDRIRNGMVHFSGVSVRLSDQLKISSRGMRPA